MKKLYTNPSMDVSIFDAENIVTESGKAAGSGQDIDTTKYSVVNVGYKDLQITF